MKLKIFNTYTLIKGAQLEIYFLIINALFNTKLSAEINKQKYNSVTVHFVILN